jgi:hypothetical protein
MSLDDVPVISYVTVIASCFWFLARLFAVLGVRQNLFIIGLVFIGLWQPFYVLPFIRGVDHVQLDYESQVPVFSYERPLRGSGYNENEPLMHRTKYFKDESGFIDSGYMGQKASYLLEQNLPKDKLADYVRYKFILYDQTSFMPKNNIDWGAVLRTVTFENSTALIGDRSGIALTNVHRPSPPVILKGPGPDFKVIGFDVNSVELNIDLTQRKFLVYNDSFHPGWRVLIDHKPAKLYQANIAFKGVWVDEGRHLVKFYFGSWVDYLRGWGGTILFVFWLILVIALFLPCLGKSHDL